MDSFNNMRVKTKLLVLTIVTVVGEDFKKPNPSVNNTDSLGIFELIGTRILLGNEEINEYGDFRRHTAMGVPGSALLSAGTPHCEGVQGGEEHHGFHGPRRTFYL